MILPFLFYCCSSFYLALRESHHATISHGLIMPVNGYDFNANDENRFVDWRWMPILSRILFASVGTSGNYLDRKPMIFCMSKNRARFSFVIPRRWKAILFSVFGRTTLREKTPSTSLLCILDAREGTKTMHYIINKIEEDGETPRYKIGNNFFESMPTLLRHYTTHYLDMTQLLRPVSDNEINRLHTSTCFVSSS